MAEKSIGEFIHADYWAPIAITSKSIVHIVMRFLHENARRILAILWIACVLVSIISCLFIGGVALGYTGVATPQPAAISGYDATATYGAQLFYQQLTAVANGK